MKKTNETNFSLPKEILDFLINLKNNNNREWFLENKKYYEENVKAPVNKLLQILADSFLSMGMPFISDPKISTFRINRDIRFSANKEPYKTQLGLFFPLSFDYVFQRNINAPCFYFHIDTESTFVAGGLHIPPPEILKYVRDKISTDYTSLESILKSKPVKNEYPSVLEGESLKRVPRGYPPDHPHEEWLRIKEYILSCELDYDTVFSDKLPEILLRKAAAIIPFLEFLNK